MAKRVEGLLQERIDLSAQLAEAQLVAAKEIVARHFDGYPQEEAGVLTAAVLNAIAINFQTRSPAR
ncbi:MAG: hypothetical protein V4573_17715 [Pseudomonadota bacterium]